MMKGSWWPGAPYYGSPQTPLWVSRGVVGGMQGGHSVLKAMQQAA